VYMLFSPSAMLFLPSMVAVSVTEKVYIGRQYHRQCRIRERRSRREAAGEASAVRSIEAMLPRRDQAFTPRPSAELPIRQQEEFTHLPTARRAMYCAGVFCER